MLFVILRCYSNVIGVVCSGGWLVLGLIDVLVVLLVVVVLVVVSCGAASLWVCGVVLKVQLRLTLKY